MLRDQVTNVKSYDDVKLVDVPERRPWSQMDEIANLCQGQASLTDQVAHMQV